MRFAYADPPYLGCCKLYDHDHGPNSWGPCWDDPLTHESLIVDLTNTFPDGWALSASSPSLGQILKRIPEEVDYRVAAWVKPFCVFKKGVRPCYAWEPVIFSGGRNPSAGFKHPPPVKGGSQTTPKDFLAESITLKKGLTGAKPLKFCLWLLDLLNFQDGDEMVDLFPGTGVMGEAVLARR